MEIAILVLAALAIAILVSIFVLLMAKNKKKSTNIDELVKKCNEEQKQDIVAEISQKYESSNKTMLDELSRNNTGLNTSLTTTIAANNDSLNKTFSNFKDSLERKFTLIETGFAEKLEKINDEMTLTLTNIKLENSKNNGETRETMLKRLADIEKEMAGKLTEMKDETINNNNIIKDMLGTRLGEIDKEIAKELKELREENQTKLDQMREVVDNKMQQTLNERINESFKVISEQLLAVSKGLGEMTNLTSGVNNLNKIMSNVKTRGICGEIFLQNLLEQILTEDQYKSQVTITKNNMVDFAVLLPGKKNDDVVYLPIDAKFPLNDYQILVEASESCDKEKVDSARKNLFKRIKEEAKSISTKYIDVPKTTNFAIMYLPIEGLYAEVVKDSSLLDEIQNKYKIVVGGPTTLTALLNSLQIGFKTLQIQKNSTEVWKALSQFKTEFARFAKALDTVKKQANTVVNSIEDTSKKTQKIEKVLNKLDTIDYDPTEIGLIGGNSDEGEESDN